MGRESSLKIEHYISRRRWDWRDTYEGGASAGNRCMTEKGNEQGDRNSGGTIRVRAVAAVVA